MKKINWAKASAIALLIIALGVIIWSSFPETRQMAPGRVNMSHYILSM